MHTPGVKIDPAWRSGLVVSAVIHGLHRLAGGGAGGEPVVALAESAIMNHHD
jgi:hypothetical protein